MKFEKCSRVLFKIIGSFLCACLLLLPVTAGAEQKDAEEVVKKMNSALLETMRRAGDLGFQGRYAFLLPVLRDTFALHYMGEKCMGSYWKDLSPEEKKEYLELYTDWTVSSYAGNFDGYSGEIFETYEGKEIGGNTVAVVSKMVKQKEESIEFDYTLRRFQDKWRIVDIRISGVSQLTTTRSQFVAVMKNKGFAELITILKEKVAVFHNGDKKG